jgi:hypothetical protein
MKEPHLEIYLNQDGDLCIARAKRSDVPFQLIVRVPPEELLTYEPADAAYRIGGSVLNLLQSWHGPLFGEREVPAVRGSEHNGSLYISALKLVDLALGAKTAAHNASIEALLQEAANESQDARKYLDEAWPLLRARLTKLSGSDDA